MEAWKNSSRSTTHLKTDSLGRISSIGPIGSLRRISQFHQSICHGSNGGNRLPLRMVAISRDVADSANDHARCRRHLACHRHTKCLHVFRDHGIANGRARVTSTAICHGTVRRCGTHADQNVFRGCWQGRIRRARQFGAVAHGRSRGPIRSWPLLPSKRLRRNVLFTFAHANAVADGFVKPMGGADRRRIRQSARDSRQDDSCRLMRLDRSHGRGGGSH